MNYTCTIESSCFNARAGSLVIVQAKANGPMSVHHLIMHNPRGNPMFIFGSISINNTPLIIPSLISSDPGIGAYIR